MILLIVLVVVALMVAGPLASIWAVNTLFLLAIPYTLKTWAASLILGLFFTNNHYKSKS